MPEADAVEARTEPPSPRTVDKLVKDEHIALAGFIPERTTDIESLETADRLGLTCGHRGRIHVTDPVRYSLNPTNNRR